jgi:hypothetical protein
MTKIDERFRFAANFTQRIHPGILSGEILFGAPGKRCEGSGICRIYTLSGANRLEDHARRVPGILLLTSRNTLNIHLNRNNLSTSLSLELFQHEYFTMEEGFVLPNYFARKLGTTRNYIPSGKYQLIHFGEWLQIEMSLINVTNLKKKN